MDAVRHHAFGPPETLTLEQVPDPTPGHGQVLVAVSAHGVHLLDTAIRRGATVGPVPLPTLPAIPGREVGGTIVDLGAGVEHSWMGVRVAAHLGPRPDGGGYARLAVVDVDALHDLPAHLATADGVAMIGTGRTAVMTLEVAAITAADTVIVTAAAGGMGSLLVQAALSAGARVLALAGGSDKVSLVEDLARRSYPAAQDRQGSCAVVDYSAPGWHVDALTALRGLGGSATAVLDGVGGDRGSSAARLLRPGGRLIVHGWSSGDRNEFDDDEVAHAARITVRAVVGPRAEPPGDLRRYQEEALARAASGQWRIHTHQVPLAEAARAHRDLEERRTTGKVVLV